MFNFEDHLERRKFITQLNAEVDKACVEHFSEGPRNHLGASVLGDDCKAKSWNTFRWLKQEKFNGQKLRLFNRGHTEEARFVQWLRLVGFQVWEVDPETGKQFRITGCNGHFGGSLDGIGWREDTGYLLLEFKTHNDKSYIKLEKDNVLVSKPMHYRQMCAYGRAYNLKYALYQAVNKNDDNLHYEIIPLNWSDADDLFRKADGIVHAATQPPRIAQVETYQDCKWCHYSGICHRGEPPDINCRSCRNARPVEGGEWFCQRHNSVIPVEVIPKACPSYARII